MEEEGILKIVERHNNRLVWSVVIVERNSAERWGTTTLYTTKLDRG